MGELSADQVDELREKRQAILDIDDPFAASRQMAFDQLFSDLYPGFLQYRVELSRNRGMPEEGTSGQTSSSASSWIVAATDRDSRQAVLMARCAIRL